MVPLGLTHIHHDAGIGDVLLRLCKLKNIKLQEPKLMQSIASLNSD